MSNIFGEQEEFEKILRLYLKVENYSRAIESLFSARQRLRTNYKPHYQRNYVWDKHKASYFIESILLGTEIPPIVVFKKDNQYEIIDGRQRYETSDRFKLNQLTLTKKGLSSLKQLAKTTYNSLADDEQGKEILNIFLSTKIRIIEFQIISTSEPDQRLEDRIKKEIFRRYNSGITPLKKFDIDNAIYVNDRISIYFKNLLASDHDFSQMMFELFFLKEAKNNKQPKNGKILQFIRKHLVLAELPIIYYARGTDRGENLSRLYDKMVSESNDIEFICNNFQDRVKLIGEIKQRFDQENYPHNRLVNECLLWSLRVLEKEGIKPKEIHEAERISKIAAQIYSQPHHFIEIESHYYSRIVNRFQYTSEIIGDSFDLNLDIYISCSSEANSKIKKLRENEVPTMIKLGELSTLRTIKPDPSRISIDDLLIMMDSKRFTIRPPYQREEVINPSKASAIIESILLDICLPPIFIYKRSDGTSEVIDGQQRLLTILGYMGAHYIDEHGNYQLSKNHQFALKSLNILQELRQKKFEELSDTLQDKILDFKLLIVEIDEHLNPEFDPVDLFVRLNYKPYPIKQNSFEMWNSWAERECIDKIKSNVKKHQDWFFIRAIKNSDGSRMENEELYASLAYLECQRIQNQDVWKYLYLCQQNNRINLRIFRSKRITRLLELVSQDEGEKEQFNHSIKGVESFIGKLKLVLLDKNIEDEAEKSKYFRSSLNEIFQAQRNFQRYTRAKQDFYVLWYVLAPINIAMVQYHRMAIKQEIRDIFNLFKTVWDDFQDVVLEDFKQAVRELHLQYAQDSRNLKLTKSQKNQAILSQGNIDFISGAPMFIGDEIHMDHIKPLSIGGKDSLDNIQITHKHSNLSKGANYPCILASETSPFPPQEDN